MTEEAEMVASEFEVVPFAQGRFRNVYKGVFATPPSEKKLQCVVKVERDEHAFHLAFGRPSIEIHNMAKELAKDFNKEKRSRKLIEYADVIAGKVDQSTYPSYPRYKEVVVVEEYVPGYFQKWCSNYGYIATGAKALEGFMHWSWVKMSGEKMIADIQGVEEHSKYLLTDPAILSNTQRGKYGPTDTGVEGIAMFFAHHGCNEVCIDLPRPILGGDFRVGVETKSQLKSISASTACDKDLKLSTEVRELMILNFPAIATS